jgi:hypothetical protein
MNKSALLNSPLCLLDVQIEGTLVEECIVQVQKELKQAGVHINLNFWISDEWFCPDGVTGIAIPFFLLDKDLIEIERESIGLVEGETKDWCLKLIRHEVAHALDNAYNLRSCEKRKSIFGDASIAYPTEYIRKPYSKSYVINLEDNYAQAHPEEDWAETFAVWLDPKSNWKETYKYWPALKKLQYVDQLIKSLDKSKCITNNETVDEIATLSIRLKTYLKRKSKNINKYQTPLFGRNLNRIFSTGTKKQAASFLIEKEKEICQKVAKKTNQYHYIVRNVFKELKTECRTKGLTLKKSQRETQRDLELLLTSKTLSYIKQGKHKVIM